MNGNGKKMSGRSSSQRSINNYPEHLNPFNEDDHHKRLRFWKFSSGKANRRNSFSINGLKDLWSFKTFKLTKKSSSLGINKTSESPPMFRHDYRYASQTTCGGSMRHTVDIGLSNDFKRGVACRSSLQNLNSISPIYSENFLRRNNNRYRSTIQAGNSSLSYQNRDSSTPVLRSHHNQSMSRGSSQLSVDSTNPFDDEYDTISQIESPQRSSIRHSGRKKRPAPQPPISPNKTNVATVVGPKVECTTDNNLNETVNIKNLTAEIESFVRTADNDKESITSKEIEVNPLKIEETNVKMNANGNENLTTSRQSPESNDYYPHDDHCEEINMEKIQNLGTNDVNSNKRSKKSPVKILIRAPSDEAIDEDSTLAKVHQTEHKKFKNDHYDSNETEQEIIIVKLDVKELNDPKEALHLQEKVLQEEEQQHKEEKDMQEDEKMVISHEENVINSAEKNVTEESIESIKIDQDNEGTTTPTSSAVEFILENQNNQNVLKITESNEDLSKSESSTNNIENQKLNEDPIVNGSKFQCDVQSVPLKSNSPTSKKKDTRTDGNKKREPPTPPQRRRSVKDIIESINKCQSLLKMNHDLNTVKIKKDKINNDLCQASSSSMKTFKGKSSFGDRNMNDTIEKQYENKKMFSDITEVNNNEKIDDMSNIPLFVEKFNELKNNNPNSIFEKCKMSDKTSNDEKVSNVEWNPVPKPRRHRHSIQESIN